MRRLVLAFFFVSGFCGLLYEIVWIRTAGTVIGNTTFAVGTVVGVFMGGLALGGWWGGRQADRRTGARLLRLYAILEAGIALSALAIPFLIQGSEPIFRALWNSVGHVAGVYGALRVILVGALLIVPTTLMGATLPVLARFLTSTIDQAGREAGRAYAINTLGGVAGTLAAGFWLVPEFGLQRTTILAAALNLAIAAASAWMARGKEGDIQPAPAPQSRLLPLPLVIAAFSGFAALLYEVAWTRSLVLALGSTVHAFTLILTAFILGLALGSAAAAWILPRLRNLSASLGAVQIAIGVLALVLLPFLGELPLRMADRMEGLRADYNALLRTQMAMTALFVLLPTLFMGAVFPLAIHLAAGPDRSVGRSVGAVYTANTLGCIAGSLAASFAFVPLIGLSATVKLAASINLLLALLLFYRFRWLMVLPGALAIAGWYLPPWNPKVMASGAFITGSADVRRARGQDLKQYLEEDTQLLDEHWDSYGLVTVHKQRNGVITMKVNGKADASTGPTDRANMLFVGHLPMLHHPAPKRALCIGLGGGLTLAAMAQHPLEKLDCVEISRAVVRGADHFKTANGGVLDDTRVNVIIGDGRNAILFGREPYDVIVSQPSNLWISGMANLFTRDFFDEASRRLAPGGIFCQWVHAYWLSPENLRDVIRTFYDVFPHGSLWEVFPGHDYLLLGSRDPIKLDGPALEARMASTKALRDYTASAPVLLGHLIADAAAARTAAGPGPLISDDRCFIEYTAPRSLGRDTRPFILEWLESFRRGQPERLLYSGFDESALSEIARRRESRRHLAMAARVYNDEPEQAMAAIEASPIPLARDPRTQLFLDLVAEQLFRKGISLVKSSDPRAAIESFRRIPSGSAAYLDAQLALGEIYIQLRRIEDSRRCYAAARAADPQSFEAAAGLARALQIAQNYPEALTAWRDVIALRPNLAPAHIQVALCLWRTNDLEGAKAACRRAMELDPKDTRAAELLKDLSNP